MSHIVCGYEHNHEVACYMAIHAGQEYRNHPLSWSEWTLFYRHRGCAMPLGDPFLCVIHRCTPDAPCLWKYCPHCHTDRRET